MAELLEIPLDLQLREAHRCIQAHWDKERKFPEFLSPMFLRRFPAIMENQLSIDLGYYLGRFYDRTPFFPITLIDTEILDDWATHPSEWEVEPKRQHSRRVLAMVRYTLPVLLQGPGCRCVPGVVCSDSIPSGAYQPERCPVILEVCEGGLCGPSVHALKADVLPSTMGGQTLYSTTH